MPNQPPARARREITKRADFRFTVPARSDRKHSWSQHAESGSYFYQVLRRWEHLAAMNHGFVYERTGTTAKNAHHYREDDAPCKRVVRRIKAFCREKGIISEDMMGRSQWGHAVRGFYLANHARCCRRLDGQHVLFPEYNSDARRLRFDIPQSPIEVPPKSAQSPTEVRAKSAPPRFEVPSGVASGVPPMATEVHVEAPGTESGRGIGMRSGMWFGSQESLESCQSYESFESLKSSPAKCSVSPKITEDQNQPPNPFFSDLTMTPKADEGKDDTPTVREYFHIDHLEVKEALSVLSAGRFDPKYLKEYKYKDELKRACMYAVDEFSEEPFVGSATRAQILGNVMDRLKDDGIDAPGYFPKLLRALRNEPDDAVAPPRQAATVNPIHGGLF